MYPMILRDTVYKKKFNYEDFSLFMFSTLSSRFIFLFQAKLNSIDKLEW